MVVDQLLLGFSFGIKADGSPGPCNEAIAKRMLKYWQSAQTKPLIAAQWEIYDALEEMGAPIKTLFPDDSLVAKPPRFIKEDIGSRGKLVELLQCPGAPAHRILFAEIQKNLQWPQVCQFGSGTKSEDIAALLDALLVQRAFYRAFHGFLDLHDLHRTNRGIVGLEKREIPRAGPGGRADLRRFQTVRVNRLIVEEILPEKLLTVSTGYQWESALLKRGEYLNTGGAAKAALGEFKRKLGGGNWRVLVYGHPEHRAWCVSETARIARELELTFQEVRAADDDSWTDAETWDAESAQVWPRSVENWRYFQSM